MRAARQVCLTGSLLVVCVAGCENPEPLGPSASRAGGVKAPTGTTAGPASSSAVHVTWIDNSANEDGFRVERSASGAGPWAAAGTTGANATSFDDGGQASEQQVCYRVVALKRNGDAGASESDCTTPPARPTNLAATAVDQQTIDLAWTDNSAVEDGYAIERASAAGGPYGNMAVVPTNTTAYRQSGLTTNTMYWYRVRANYDGGYGDYSIVASGVPAPRPPLAPTGTNATPTFVGGVGITWIDRSTNEDGFRVERSFDSGATWATVFSLRPNTTDLGDFYGAPSERYVCYRVFAFNALGDSPPSNMDCTTPPAGPTSLTATGLGNQAIALSWTDNSAVEDGYEVKRATAYDGVYSVVANVPANSTTYSDVGVSSNWTYWYIVRANKDGGHSPYSNYASGVAATEAPAAPSETSARPIGSSQTNVWWRDNATNAQGFRVERSLDSGGSWATAATTGPAQYGAGVIVDAGRTAEQPVCYRVVAFNSQGDSPPSNTACTTPPAGPTNLTVTLVDEQTIDVTWTDNSAVEDGYQVQFIDGENYCAIIDLPPNSTTTRFTDPTASCWWQVQVIATKDGGWSDGASWPPPPASSSSASASSASSPRVRP